MQTLKCLRISLAAICLACLFIALPASAQEARDARWILDHVDDLYRGKSAHGRMVMTVQTEHWKRALSLEFWSKGKEHSLVRILAPEKEKGTATLRVLNDIWNFLPKVKRVIKVPSSMMSSSWMGSHFTNNDLVKESRMADDYTYQITFQGQREGQEVIELTCLPKPESAVVWGKVIVRVKAGNYMPLDIIYFDEDMQPARTMIMDQVRELGGRQLPSRAKVVPADKPNEFTEVLYNQIDFDIDLKESFFSLRTLQR
jgi:outer membrane lipoprotein-sorting protein